ncbi:MAG: FAD-dependent monooxygenase [Pseudomonadota bacterium]
MRVIIAGGGIGGMALALALAEEGMEALVFERATSIRELGVGINILPHAVEHLTRWGLLEGLDAAGLRTAELIYKTARGQDILAQPRGLAAGLSAPQFSIHRGMLLGVVAAGARERLGAEAIHTGHRLTGFEEGPEGITASFETAEGTVRIAGDVLVGADGIHSTVRSALAGQEEPPRWNGVLMWRGAAWAPSFLTCHSMIIAGGMAAKLVLYPIHADPSRPGERLTNWVICAAKGAPGDPLPLDQDWQAPATADEALAEAAGLHVDEVDLEALVRASEPINLYPMCDREPLARWGAPGGRVTLLGDAAHPMYPVGSNGASQAVLDAVSLAKALAAHGPAGLAAYEAERRPATAEIVLANRKGGPEQVIDLVEERAPQGFDDLDAVATRAELEAIVGSYQRITATRSDMPA